MSGYRNDDISGAFGGNGGGRRRDRKRPRGDRGGDARDRGGDARGGDHVTIDRTSTPPFLIRVFPYVVTRADIQDLPDKKGLFQTGTISKPVGSAGLSKAYRSPETYKFVFNPEEASEGSEASIEEIRVYTYADATLKSVLDEVKEEMGKRGLLGGEEGRLGISVAAAWEEWHRNDEKFFMRCRSIGKVGMGEAWAKTASGLGIDPRGFPDKSNSELRELKWNVGDAMDVCFLYV